MNFGSYSEKVFASWEDYCKLVVSDEFVKLAERGRAWKRNSFGYRGALGVWDYESRCSAEVQFNEFASQEFPSSEKVLCQKVRTALWCHVFELGHVSAGARVKGVREVFANPNGNLLLDVCGNTRFVLVPDVLSRENTSLAKQIVRETQAQIHEQKPFGDIDYTPWLRAHVVLEPVSPSGPAITIRVHETQSNWNLEDFFCAEKCEMVREVLKSRHNVLVVGSTGSGKTSLISAMLQEINSTERLIVVEDTAEIKVARDQNCVRLIANCLSETPGKATLKDLVREALRMRPDRFVLGECRGPEAVSVLHALSSGHNGSLTSLHASDPKGAIQRFSALVLEALPNATLEKIQNWVVDCFSHVILLERCREGSERPKAEIFRLDLDQGDGNLKCLKL
jgi:pilus assembly protein CpaF